MQQTLACIFYCMTQFCFRFCWQTCYRSIDWMKLYFSFGQIDSDCWAPHHHYILFIDHQDYVQTRNKTQNKDIQLYFVHNWRFMNLKIYDTKQNENKVSQQTFQQIIYRTNPNQKQKQQKNHLRLFISDIGNVPCNAVVNWPMRPSSAPFSLINWLVWNENMWWSTSWAVWEIVTFFPVVIFSISLHLWFVLWLTAWVEKCQIEIFLCFQIGTIPWTRPRSWSWSNTNKVSNEIMTRRKWKKTINSKEKKKKYQPQVLTSTPKEHDRVLFVKFYLHTLNNFLRNEWSKNSGVWQCMTKWLIKLLAFNQACCVQKHVWWFGCWFERLNYSKTCANELCFIQRNWLTIWNKHIKTCVFANFWWFPIWVTNKRKKGKWMFRIIEKTKTKNNNQHTHTRE